MYFKMGDKIMYEDLEKYRSMKHRKYSTVFGTTVQFFFQEQNVHFIKV